MGASFTIKSHLREYHVEFVRDPRYLENLAADNHSIFFVDQRALELHSHLFSGVKEERLIKLPIREEIKTIGTVAELYRTLLQRNIRRSDVLVAVGGGITQDIIGFLSSTLFRGIEWIFVPTTLLAQADSCIGSKTSLNFDSYKNIVGTFYPPKTIFIDIQFLKTLDTLDLASGMGEIIKILLADVKSERDLHDLEENFKGGLRNTDEITLFIERALEVKRIYVEEDEFDTGRRSILNYGHTFGHALEAVSLYKIPHGLGVVMGMICANIIAKNRGLIETAVFNQVTYKILVPNLHLKELKLKKDYFDVPSLLEKIRKDKKRTTQDLSFILPERFFELKKFSDVTGDEFKTALSELVRIVGLY